MATELSGLGVIRGTMLEIVFSDWEKPRNASWYRSLGP